MAEPARKPVDELERETDAAIAVCDGDTRAALQAALVYVAFLERKLERFRGMISSGYGRGRVRRPAKSARELVAEREPVAERELVAKDAASPPSALIPDGSAIGPARRGQSIPRPA
jgi:hypothetical protein